MTGRLTPIVKTAVKTVANAADARARGVESRERAASPWLGRDSPPSGALVPSQDLDRRLAPGGIVPDISVAPSTVVGAFMDWWVHLLGSPAKQWELVDFGAKQWMHAWQTAATNAGAVRPMPQDKRFDDPVWQELPYRLLKQTFLLREEWWQKAT